MLYQLKKTSLIAITLLFLGSVLPGAISAQGMMGFSRGAVDSSSLQSQQQEEQEGKTLVDKLTNKTIVCSDITESDFEKIGEYFMGQSIGDTARHISMNDMMKRMMGDKGEEQAHTVMGKRYSGCDTTATFAQQDVGFMSMMNLVGGGFTTPNSINQGGATMMGAWGTPFGGGGWLLMAFWWIIIVLCSVVFIKWLMSRSGNTQTSPLDILKKRYAKGEIDKKEFEERKKDLSL